MKWPKFVKTKSFLFAAGLVIGVLAILIIRFATYSIGGVHYHANFDVYINGQQELFKGPGFYEETTACKAGNNIAPAQRAHMHNNVPDVVHVHDHAVSWGQFFNNLGWTLGPNFIAVGGTVYQENGDQKLNIILNGQDLTDLGSIANRVIGDQDRLLIDFGSPSQQTLQKEYKAVPATAKHYDETVDPKSCSGTQAATFHDRITHLF